MQTDRTTKALLGIIVFLGLGALQACMALQEGSGDCSLDSPEACRVQAEAEAGDASAQFNLGVMYDRSRSQDTWTYPNTIGYIGLGRGVAEDDAEAVRWFRMAAAQGNAVGQVNLGLMLDTGTGVPEDDAEAVRWFRMAAAQGNATAQFILGDKYDNGEDVVQNDARAYLWLNLAAAASQGDDRARMVEARDRVAAKLSPADRAAAQRLATQCQASDFQDCGESE